ncbi:MAG: DUF456 domain-containing protein [Frankia sp.]|nr:DUF456 domain-containing protein [Frankia sp.]
MHLLVGLVLAVGIVGTVLPVLPGLILVLAAGLWWTIADGGGARWAVFAVMAALVVLGMVAKYVLPARATANRGAPWTTLLVGVIGAIAGFFLIPVVGLVVGGVLGIYLAEVVRLKGDWRAAWGSTWAALLAFGIGLLIEIVAGVAAALAWLAGALVF